MKEAGKVILITLGVIVILIGGILALGYQMNKYGDLINAVINK